MRVRPGVLIGVVAGLALLFGGRYLGWFGNGSQSTPKVPKVPGPMSGETPVPVTGVPSIKPSNPQPAVSGSSSKIGSRGSPLVPPPAAPVTTVVTDWEQRIDEVLTGQEDENQKAKRLLELLPSLPEDGQVEAAQHLSNLLPDEDYSSLSPTLTNAVTPEAVLDVLMTDVLNRPNPLKLGTLLEVARTPNHPKAEEARDVLEVYVDENFGADWIAWDTAVKKWLKENPDE